MFSEVGLLAVLAYGNPSNHLTRRCLQVNSHQADGMMALYNITGQQPAYPTNGTVRTYYIQAVRVCTHTRVLTAYTQ